jgi:hypothetical protein
VRKRTSFELAAGDQNAGPGRQLDRVHAEIDDAAETVAAVEGEDRFARVEPGQIAVAEARRFPP